MGEQKRITLIEVAYIDYIKTGNFWVISDLKCLSDALLHVLKNYKVR